MPDLLLFLFKPICKPDKKEHFRYQHNEYGGIQDVPFKFGIVHGFFIWLYGLNCIIVLVLSGASPPAPLCLIRLSGTFSKWRREAVAIKFGEGCLSEMLFMNFRYLTASIFKDILLKKPVINCYCGS